MLPVQNRRSPPRVSSKEKKPDYDFIKSAKPLAVNLKTFDFGSATTVDRIGIETTDDADQTAAQVSTPADTDPRS
jgi:hypothetical protein